MNDRKNVKVEFGPDGGAVLRVRGGRAELTRREALDLAEQLLLTAEPEQYELTPRAWERGRR